MIERASISESEDINTLDSTAVVNLDVKVEQLNNLDQTDDGGTVVRGLYSLHSGRRHSDHYRGAYEVRYIDRFYCNDDIFPSLCNACKRNASVRFSSEASHDTRVD